MSDRNNQGSRWSSAREREERDRQRKAQREEAKRTRLEREAGKQSTGSSFSESTQRRLTDDERRTIREYRFPSASERTKPGSETPRAPVSPAPATSPTASSLASGGAASSGTSTRWRDSVAPPVVPGGPGLPDLPGDGNGSGGKRPGNGRLLIFGIGLFAVMALVAFLPFGPFGGDDDERDIPTPSATLPTILDTGNGEDPDADSEAEPAGQPAAGDGQAIVCIDPGHGGWDTGWDRTGLGDEPYSSPIVTEAEINLGMAYMLKAELEAEGIFVVLTRPSGAAVNLFDEDINDDGETRLNADNPEQAGSRDELQARINVCNEADADVLISIHINGFDNREVRGYEMFYTAEREFGVQNEVLATLVYRQLDTAMRGTEEMSGVARGVHPDTAIEGPQHDVGSAEHFLMTGPAVEVASIEPSLMPGLIVEAAFLSNDLDAVWLVQPENQRFVVRAYARGILDYFDEYPPA
ncbi:MAG: N-acetylmuramoyl-L-alanine amidase [Chloroflexia bacterium]|nr:N-acetylmuramoyl-L-alanine amidase [Chloroflexia bacterium]